MKKIKISDKIKLGILVVLLAVGFNMVSAWVGPTAPAPGNDVTGLIDISDTEQSKGGSPVPGYFFDVNGVLSGINLAVWNDSHVLTGYTKVTNLNPDSLEHYVCADHTGKLVTCGSSGGGGAVCGNSIVEGAEDCDNGAANGPSPATCSTSCMFNGGGGGGPIGNAIFTGNFRWGKINLVGVPANHPPLVVHVNLHGALAPVTTSTGGPHVPETLFYIPANSTTSYKDPGYTSPCNGIGCEIEGTGGFMYGVVTSVTGASLSNIIVSPFKTCRFDADPPPDGQYFAVEPTSSCPSGATQY